MTLDKKQVVLEFIPVCTMSVFNCVLAHFCALSPDRHDLDVNFRPEKLFITTDYFPMKSINKRLTFSQGCLRKK